MCTELLFLAFPGIIKWQHRLWLTIREFITHRTEALKGNENYNRSDDFEDKEKKLNDSRNYFVSSINYYLRYFYTLSVAISRQQGLTSSLRVSFHGNQIF